MHISTVNISQTVTNRKNIAIANKYEVAYGISIGILHLTLDHSKGQGQGHAHFDCEYSAVGKNRANIIISIKYAVAYGLSISIFMFDVGPF